MLDYYKVYCAYFQKLQYLFVTGIVLISVYIFSKITGLTSCPVYHIFGIPCPLCGMSRSYSSLLELDFERAYYYHPLFWLVPIALFIYGISYFIPKKVFKILLLVIALIFFITWIYNFITKFPNHEVMYFNDNSVLGTIIKVLNYIFK